MSVRSLRYNTIEQHFTKGVTASTDRDALAFLEAAQIYNTNQQRAIVNLVRSLKRVGLWSKMKAIYPFVGGTASSHKWNLKDPRDVDAAFRLTFAGGWTHSSTGATPNGTNGYADTYIKPNNVVGLNSNHASFYSRTNASGGRELGCSDNAVNELPIFALILRNGSNRSLWVSPDYNASAGRVDYANTDSTGYYIGSRTANNASEGYKNGTSQHTNTNAHSQTALPSLNNIVLSAYKYYIGVGEYSTKECAFATIGDGLTDTDASNLYNIVDLYQRRLGRAV